MAKMTKSINWHIKIKLSATAFWIHIAGFMISTNMSEMYAVSNVTKSLQIKVIQFMFKIRLFAITPLFHHVKKLETLPCWCATILLSIARKGRY